MKVFSLMILIVLFSCSSSKDAGSSDKKPSVTTTKKMEFESIAKGTNSEFVKKQNQVITKIEDLDKAWSVAFAGAVRSKPVPVIDFETQMVLLVALGERTNGGYAIKLNEIREKDKYIEVDVVESQPGKTCVTPSVIVYPYEIVVVEKSEKEVVFKDLQQIIACEK